MKKKWHSSIDFWGIWKLPHFGKLLMCIFCWLKQILPVINIIDANIKSPCLFFCITLYMTEWWDQVYTDNGIDDKMSPCSRSVKRLEGITKSPIFSQLSSSLIGLSSIRAFKAEDMMINEFDHHQDIHTSAFFSAIG